MRSAVIALWKQPGRPQTIQRRRSRAKYVLAKVVPSILREMSVNFVNGVLISNAYRASREEEPRCGVVGGRQANKRALGPDAR